MLDQVAKSHLNSKFILESHLTLYYKCQDVPSVPGLILYLSSNELTISRQRIVHILVLALDLFASVFVYWSPR